MKVCIIGAGAIGGWMGTKLATAGCAEVGVLARGDTLAALRTHGWRLQTADGLMQVRVRAEDDAGKLGMQDVIVIAVKAPALTNVARSLAPLMGPDTLVMPAMNGVPWWFCHGVAGFPGRALESVDPGGEIDAAIPWRQVLGCVVHASASTVAPGLVRHNMGQGLIVGAAHGARKNQVQRVVDLLTHAGFEATHAADIRFDIWYKLWGNMTMNPISAITGAASDRMLADPLVRDFCSAAMIEAQRIGQQIGCAITQTPDARHDITAALGSFKTSMLQDVEAGRPIELDALVGAVREIGQRLGMPTPNIDALYGVTRLFGRVHGLYPDPA